MLDFHYAQGNYEALFQLGNVFLGERKPDLAANCYRKAIELKPDHAAALQNLGIACQAMGQHAEARECFARVAKLFPGEAAPHFHLANACDGLGLVDEAIAAFQACIALRADNPEPHHRLGVLLHRCGRTDEAIASMERAVACGPQHPALHNDLGILLAERGLMEQAITCFEKAVKLQPRFVDAHCNLGAALQSLGRGGDAQKSYRKALSIKPDMVRAHFNLGLVLQERGSLDESIASLRKAISIQPDYAEAHNALGNALREKGRRDEAIASYREALRLNPDFHTARLNLLHELQHVCDWRELDALVEQVRAAVRDPVISRENLIAPFSFLALPGVSAAEQRCCAEKWVASQYGALVPLREQLDFRFEPREAGERIHIGYLSSDFHRHATAVLMAEVFEKHDREHFRISAYSYGASDNSDMRRRLEGSFDAFVDVRELSLGDVAKRIHADKVDILVDLKGYTQNTRSGVLALRPAPVQVNYLGYPGTMGADFVDYIIADEFIIPTEMEQHYAERVARLPDCYQPNDRTRPRLPAPSRAECGLPDEGVVFCCFNQSYKITPAVFEVWCRLLLDVPDSVLWLLASNPFAEQQQRQHLVARGIAPERLVIAPRVAEYVHLARLQCADLFLDTQPYNAHTSCSEALWMGVPVVTCVGDTFPARVAGSLLTAMGTPELITYTLDDYHALALSLARDGARREALHTRLCELRDSAPLFDSSRFTTHLEALYTQMWRDRQGSL